MNAKQFSSALGKVNDKYIMEAITYERKKKSGWLKWGAMAACFGLIVTVAMAALPGLLKGPGGVAPPPNPNLGPGVSDTVPQKTINVVDLSQSNPGEFAGDMYRPKGFDDNIGSALALKISITDDINYKYSVLVRTPLESTLEQVLNNANKSLNVTINATDAISVNISGAFDAYNGYYYFLTAEQIFALAENGARCFYVGSGQGDYEDINWDTKDGISTFCELNGDMYILAGESIEAHPDIGVLPDKGSAPTEYPDTIIVPGFDLDEPSEPNTP